MYVEKRVFAGDGIVDVDIQDPSPMQVFAKTVSLEGFLSMLKTESGRYTEQNGRMFQTTFLRALSISWNKHFNGYSQTS